MSASTAPQFDRDIDPEEIFTFVVQPGDLGDRADPERCVFARCAKRTMRTDAAWFGLSVGYVQLGDEIVRFGYTAKLYDAIHQFDDEGRMSAGVYQVAPVRPSVKRETKAERNKRYRGERDGTRPKAGQRSTWHAPRGWGRGVTETGEAV
jgi:hypothetical protein